MNSERNTLPNLNRNNPVQHSYPLSVDGSGIDRPSPRRKRGEKSEGGKDFV